MESTILQLKGTDLLVRQRVEAATTPDGPVDEAEQTRLNGIRGEISDLTSSPVYGTYRRIADWFMQGEPCISHEGAVRDLSSTVDALQLLTNALTEIRDAIRDDPGQEVRFIEKGIPTTKRVWPSPQPPSEV